MHAAADTLLAGASHRKLFVEDEATGVAARPSFADRGWDTERDAMLVRVGPPPPPPEGVREVPLAATRALRIEWYGAQEAGHAVAAEPYAERRGMRAFMAGDDGFAWAVAGEIDQLYVSERARGRGVGSALLAAAMQGREHWWIVADDEGDAKRLYERHGFTTVWRPHAFTRRPS
jgi:ribosomal protein S18 acetylase RimI-like enzyme